MRDHRKLRAFQFADALVLMIYETTRAFPREELFALTSQMRRAAYSVPGNTTEGCAKRTQRDYLHYLDIAFGSLRELGYYIDFSKRLGYLSPESGTRLEQQYDQTARSLAALINSLRQ